ncbi:MAG: polyprenyl synthetase family protein [Rectinema sp.]|nr:polyprenyl synthetase family protein [Rectinema sp.]
MTHYWKDLPDIERFLDHVEALILSTFDRNSFPLADDMRAMVESGGKMLRPALVYIGGKFGLANKKRQRAKDEDRLIHIAAAIEMLHTATLIHDDIIDRASHRRGIPSIHQKAGTTSAILAGDWLFSQCYRIIATYLKPDRAVLLAEFVSAICKAEIQQDLDKYRFNPSRRRYLQTIAGKTAALFSLALHIGASETGCNSAVTQRLRRTGYNLGMAFQIIDDILDYESSLETLKKPVGNDIREGLCTLPLIFALEEKPEELRPLLAKVHNKNAPVSHIVEIVRSTAALPKAREEAGRYTRLARKEIAGLPEGEAREIIAKLVESLLIRDF